MTSGGGTIVDSSSWTALQTTAVAAPPLALPLVVVEDEFNLTIDAFLLSDSEVVVALLEDATSLPFRFFLSLSRIIWRKR